MLENPVETRPQGAERSYTRPLRPWHLKHEAAPAGGYVRVPVAQLAMIWQARAERKISPIAFAAWWGWQEILTRRTVGRLPKDREPDFRVPELVRLLGLGQDEEGRAKARRATRELVKAGLLRWDDGRPVLSTSPDQLAGDTSGTFAFMEAVTNRARKVPVPRRWVRWLAGGVRRSSAAAAIATAIRCLYVRAGKIDPNGAWAASVMGPRFGMSERSLRIGRKRMEDQGMLRPHPTPAYYLRRYGVRLSVELGWDPQAEVQAAAAEPADGAVAEGDPVDESSGDFCEDGAVSSGPLHQHPLARARQKHQQPALQRKQGVSKSSATTEQTCRTSREKHPPSLRKILPLDLEDGERFDDLREQAVASGLCRPGERGRVAWWGAREHVARLVAERGGSKVRFFAWMIRRQAWNLVTDGDEAEGVQRRARLVRDADRRREEEAGRAEAAVERAHEDCYGGLEGDARLLHAAQVALARGRLGAHCLLPMLRTRDRSWTAGRVEAAAGVLAEWSRTQAAGR